MRASSTAVAKCSRKCSASSESSRIYVATTPIGTHGLEALAADGIGQIVVPENNLASLPNAAPATTQWPYTLSGPFRIAGSTVEGLQADAGLAAHLSGPASPALRAQQLLADLAELYFDSPDFPQPRGVALVAPEYWVPATGFLSATLQGLASSPIVTTVPISQLFKAVPPGTCQEPPSRRHRLLSCGSLDREPETQCQWVDHVRPSASGTQSARGALFDHSEQHRDDKQPR